MSQTININKTNRFVFLDNLRTLMVLLVLVFHSGASYGSAVDFWPFHEANPNGIIDLFMFLLDMFMMVILFLCRRILCLAIHTEKRLLPVSGGQIQALRGSVADRDHPVASPARLSPLSK